MALLVADAGAPAQAAVTRSTAYAFDLPAGSLSDSLARFSALTGISVGISGAMPMLGARRVKGRMTADAALRALLKGTGWEAHRLGTVYRLEHRMEGLAARQIAPEKPVAPAQPATPIIVTAQKRPQALSSVPMSLSLVSLDAMRNGGATPSSQDISLSTEGLATTNLGPGRDRQFIRGVADSPFIGKSQSTVAVQIDDARATFDAPNPDLRLIDIDRVEILKGPQGPLYGSGALGGIYHIVTHMPELGKASAWTQLSLEGVDHGAIAAGLQGVANIPIVDDRLALRAVGYRVVDPGWIDNSDGRKNSNSTKTAGGRLALRWRPSPDWTIDLGGSIQDIDVRDSQYVLAKAEALRRDSRIAEPTRNDFNMAHMTVTGEFGGVRLVSASSFVDQRFDYILDATDAAAGFGLTGTAAFEDDRTYHVFNQELRLSPRDGRRWLVGLSVLRATTTDASTITGETGPAQTVETLDRRTTEYAVFGEAHQRLFGAIDATVGARVSRSVSRDLATEQTADRTLRRRKIVASPSASLSLPLNGRGIVYLRYARAKRPGGLAPADAGDSGEFKSDKVNSFDLGVRRTLAREALFLSSSLFYTRWDRVQSDYLLSNGLVSTRNAGRASIVGIEVGLDWHLPGRITIAAGGAYQRARLVRSEDGTELEDLRLPVVPSVTGRLRVAKQVSLLGWQGQAGVQANYIGRSSLSFDTGLVRTMGDYALLSATAEMSKRSWTIGAKMSNMLGVRADSFAFGNAFSIRGSRQYTPVTPRVISLSARWRW